MSSDFHAMQQPPSSASPLKLAELDDIEDLNMRTIPNPDIMKNINLIKQMRRLMDAPVDTMGVHTCADQNADPKIFRFQILVALMLSSQTKDQVTSAAMKKLRESGCTIPSICNVSKEYLAEVLKPVGFYKKKAEYLKRTSIILRDKYGGDIPNTFEGLCSLPGIGPKMANLALQIAFQRCEGIGVDTHVYRISNRLRWVTTNNPEQTEFKLREVLPRKEWSTINQLLVGFGQTICLPVNPKCSECLINKLCPWQQTRRMDKTT